MDGLKDVLKSKKFWGAVIGAGVVALEGVYFKDHPQMLEILMTTAGLFGVQVAGQAHADANDDSYKSKKK